MSSLPPLPVALLDPTLQQAIPGQISAYLTSLDTGHQYRFEIEPSEQDRSYGATWSDADVIHASPQRLEFKERKRERRVIKFALNASRRRGGIVNSLEPDLAALKKFTELVPGLPRAHVCLYTQGEQYFECVVVDIHIPQYRVNTGGGAMMARDCTITLEEVG